MMNRIRKMPSLMIALLLLGLSLLAFGLVLAAAEQGGSGKVVERSKMDFPLTGVALEVTKVLDSTTGQAYQVAVDGDGKGVDLAAVAAEEARAGLAIYGKLNPRLYGKLAQMKENDQIRVSIWLNAPDSPLWRPQPDAAMTAEAARAALASHRDRTAQYMAPKRQGVIEALARMGVPAIVPMYGPAVFASLTPGQIRMISKHPDVSTIYGPEEYTLFSDDASTTHRAYRVWQAGNLGFGTSSRPIVHEPDGVSYYNPYLSNTNHPVIYWNSKTKNIGPHATEVAGTIASTHPLFRGMAPKAPLILSANSQDFTDANLVNAFEWAFYNGGCPTNMSWGTICGGDQTFMSRYVDWAAKNLWATFVISAGNMGACADPTIDQKVSAPGLAWMAITVGSQKDNNNGFWSGDTMSTWSRWVNPNFATGMEKPEVVAVGEDVMTTDDAGGDWLTSAGVNGTSFSAPMVAGQVVQMLGRRPGQIIWPETNKAAVLASAFHDIDPGASKDGVGSVMMNISDDTYRLDRFLNVSGAGGFPLGAGDFPVQKLDVLSLQAGQRVRVAVCWDSWSTGGAGTDVLGADLDLQVRHPDNTTIVAGSYSIINAWELVDFVAPVTGNYDILVNKFSSDANWPGTFLGIAWSIYNKPNFTSGLTNVLSTGGTFAVNTANGGTYFDSYPGVSWNESGRERVYRLKLTSTKDITVTDNNGNLDLFVLQFPDVNADPLVPTVKGYGVNSVIIDNAPPGIYWIVVDGYNGYVGSATMTVSVTGP